VKLNRSVLRKMIVESLLQEQSTADKVRELQADWLYISDEVGDEHKQGKWGPKTQEYWQKFLSNYGDVVEELTGIPGSELAKEGGWSKQTKYAKSMSGVLKFMMDIDDKPEITREKTKKALDLSDVGGDLPGDTSGRKEGAKEKPKKKEEPKPKPKQTMRYKSSEGANGVSVDPLRITPGEITALSGQGVLKINSNLMFKDLRRKNFYDRFREADGSKVDDSRIKFLAKRAVEQNKNITNTVKGRIIDQQKNSLMSSKFKGSRAFPIEPTTNPVTKLEVTAFLHYPDTQKSGDPVSNCILFLRYVADGDPVPLIKVTNLLYSKSKGIYAKPSVNESKQLNKNFLRSLILKTLKEHGEI